MTLRVRLLVGYGYLVALLLVVAGSAMVGFIGLSERLQVALEEGMEETAAVAGDRNGGGSAERATALRERALLAAEREARDAALRSGAWLGFLVVVALVSLIFLSRALQRQILARLAELRRGVASIEAGGHRRLWEQGTDELAGIARHVNGLLDRYEALEGRSRGRLAQERRLVLGLVAALGEEAVLFDGSGRRVAGDAAWLEAGRDGVKGASGEDRVSEWIREEGRTGEEGDRAGTEPVRERLEGPDGTTLEVSLLVAPGGRPAGWLVRPV